MKITSQIIDKIKIDSNIVNRLPIGVILIDSSGVIQDANFMAKQLLECELIASEWIDVVNKVFSPKQDDGHEISLKNGKRVNLTTIALMPTPGQMITLYDVTATRALQSEIASKVRLIEIGKMSANLAHQIRTPLSSMLLYLSNLQSPHLSDIKKNKFLQQIKISIKYLEQQVNDMLLFAKGGHSTVNFITVSRLFNDVKNKISAFIDENDINFLMIDETSEVSFNANLESLSAAIQNLIQNAIQAAGSHTTITVKAIIKNSFLEISVEDNGVGIHQKDLDLITKPFYTTKEKGTGLGLSVVQSVIKAHYGEMKINTQINKGTTFTLRMPIKI